MFGIFVIIQHPLVTVDVINIFTATLLQPSYNSYTN